MKLSTRNLLYMTIALFTALIPATLSAQTEILKSDAIASFYGDDYHGRPTSSGEIFNMNALTAAHKTLPFGTMVEVTNLSNGRKVTVRINDRGPYIDGREIDLSKAAAEQLDMLKTGTARVSMRLAGNAASAAAAATLAPSASQTVASQAPVKQAPAVNQAAQPKANVTANAAVSPGATSTANSMTATPITAIPSATAPAVSVSAIPPALTATAQITGVSWRIQLGSFSQEENATRLVVRLRNEGFNPAFERHENMVRVVLSGIRDSELPSFKEKLRLAGYTDILIRQESW